MVGAQATQTSDRSPVDPALDAFIAKIRAVDNHTHANTTSPDDSEYDALPLDALLPFPFPVRLRPESPNWLAADRTLYGYPHADLNEPHVIELRRTRERVAKEQGDRFPEWVLDRVGTEVMLANRVAMGPGLAPPRFRWVSYVDSLMLPLSTKAEAAVSPDRAKLYPFEEKLLRRYRADVNVATLPPTLDAYLLAVVTPTLERQRKGGCVAVKFEAAFLRSLDFDDAPAETASRVYSRYVAGGEPPRAEYKALQDFLFRYIAREAGRLGMAVHIHSFEGAGVFYRAAGCDPLLLESAFNDPTLSATNFVIVHGGGVYAPLAGAMLWKPNVYVDTSAMALIYPPAKLARVLEDWLIQFPEKVLFGTDAAAFGPDIGWEVAAWVGTTTARQALGIALTDMMRNGDLSRARAEEIATMVLRTNAGKLYNLRLP
jgi:predicted TIM-barrel fold metal-dependent hydrolase